MKQNLRYKVLSMGAVRAAALPISFASSIFLARELGVNGYGTYAFAMSLASLVSLPLGAGAQQLLVREVALALALKDLALLRGLILRAFEWGILSYGATLVIYGSYVSWSDGSELHETARLFAIVLLAPLFSFASIIAGILQGLGWQVGSQLPPVIIRPLLLLLLSAFAAYLGYRLNLLLVLQCQLAATVAATALAFILGLARIRCVLRPGLPRSKIRYDDRRWLKSALTFTALAIASGFNVEIAIQFLGWMGSSTDVAALRVAQSGSQLVNLPLLSVNMVIGPHIAQMFSNRDYAQIDLTYRRYRKFVFAASAAIALPLIVFGRLIVSKIYGAAYSEISYFPLVIMCLGQVYNSFTGSVGLFLSMAGHERATFVAESVALFASSLAATLMIPLLGATGGALSVCIGLIVWNTILAIRLRRVITRTHPQKDYK